MNNILSLDVDSTLMTFEYPKLGLDIGAIPYLIKLQEMGVKMILNTMRCGKELEDADTWLKQRGIVVWGLNKNPTQKSWTDSPKVYAHLYVDDAAFGCPLVLDKEKSDRPFVNWDIVGPELIRWASQ